ncbi:MAG: sorbosone dehydrogenase family protein [Bacteroidetes bacterium]|nr:sorbosone dehydrogenase family protein [Bacteroidota bacterium]
MSKLGFLPFIVLFSIPYCFPFIGWSEINLENIKLPKGFKIAVYAEGVENARSMVWGDNGTLFVSTRGKGSVYAVLDNNNDYKADRVVEIDKNLNMPNGVAFRDGSLYVAEVNRILRYDNIESSLEDPPKPVVVFDQLPDDRHHGWKYIAFGPDGKLYIPVGAPCNICEPKKEIYASICRMNPDGSEFEIIASGVRNSVGFAWHPKTGELWFTDNGRDMLGDDQPPDELNRISKNGQNFGYPYCHGGFVKDPEYGEKYPCSDFVRPAQNLGPHVAALGMKFYQGNMFPKKYQKMIFICEHGSWNRSKPIGYRITTVLLKGNKAVEYNVFAEGWLQGNDTDGRPVDIIEMKDGSVLVSDDYADVIYRITYSAQ